MTHMRLPTVSKQWPAWRSWRTTRARRCAYTVRPTPFGTRLGWRAPPSTTAGWERGWAACCSRRVTQSELDQQRSATMAAWASRGTAKHDYAVAVARCGHVAVWVFAHRATGRPHCGDGHAPGEVVLDMNVFVAAGFNPGSHSARIVEAVRNGRLRMVWDNATQAENQAGDTADTALVTESYRGPVPLGGPVLRFDGS